MPFYINGQAIAEPDSISGAFPSADAGSMEIAGADQGEYRLTDLGEVFPAGRYRLRTVDDTVTLQRNAGSGSAMANHPTNWSSATTLATWTSTGQYTIPDDVSLRLGTDGDQVLRSRSTVLAANTALTGVLVGVPVAQALAANSLIVSNVTASGDQAFYGNLGGNSIQWLYYDTSASSAYLYGDGLAGVFVNSTRSGFTSQDLAGVAAGAVTISNSASARFTAWSIGAVTATLAGQTQVTSLFYYSGVSTVTIAQSGGAVTVDKATALSLNPPTAGALVTLTHGSGLRVLTNGVAVNLSGIYLEPQTGGTTGNYQLLLANGGGAAPALADHVGVYAIDTGAGDARLYVQSEAGSPILLGNDRLRYAATVGIIDVGGTSVLSASNASVAFYASSNGNRRFYIGGTHSGDASGGIVGTLITDTGETRSANSGVLIGASFGSTFTVSAGATATITAQVYAIGNAITNSGTATTAATVYVSGPMSGAATNYAILIDDGVLATDEEVHFRASADIAGGAADLVKLGGYDLSAGNRTLALATETAVAVDVIAASTHTLQVRINGTTYKILLST